MPHPPTITRLADLEALYDDPVEASLVKEADRVVPVYRAFIEAAPFAALATNGPDGLDCSPRGDAPGFVTVADEKTLLLPDRRGNNRIDSLRNIVNDPRVALLFLIPGIGETLRVNGRAAISTAPDLLARFAIDGSRTADRPGDRRRIGVLPMLARHRALASVERRIRRLRARRFRARATCWRP